MTRWWLLGVALLAPLPALAQGAVATPESWLPRGKAELIVLDKLRAQPTTVTVPTGQAARVGTLSLTVQRCVVRPANVPQNAAAFLDASDGRGNAPVFHGWIFSNTPAVSQLEHPVYAVRLVGCQ